MTNPRPRRRKTWSAAAGGWGVAPVAAALLMAGCASTGEATGETDAPRPSLIAVDDPWEGMNRHLYAFNALADRWVLLPVVDAYTFVVPWPIRDRVSDFFGNLGDLVTFGNQLLQLKLPEAGQTALRFGTNSLIGMFGLVDIATPMGLPKYQEDFGQTLGYWGVGAGPYLVLPILGPSSVRDTAGLATDTVAFAVVDPFGASSIQTKYPPITAVDAVNSRYEQSFRYYQSGSPFEYDLVRFLYIKTRQVQIGEIGPSAAPDQPAGVLGGAVRP